MLWGGSTGGLELRTLADGATCLRGRFPFNKPTTLSDGPPRRREVFGARAFGEPGDVHLLVHHDFDKPLASVSAGSLTLRNDDDALTFEARIAPEMRGVSYVQDFLGALKAGLVGGVSPGFRVPADGDYAKRDGQGVMRVVKKADLIEISAVTKPAYPAAQIEARSWDAPKTNEAGFQHLKRWRL